MLKSNKMLKISLCIVMIIAIIGITSISNASFVEVSITPSTGSGTSVVTNIGGGVLGVVQTIGYIVAVIVLVWLGIKYIMASPDGKAEIKKQAFAYILGAVLLFAASTLVGVFKNWTESTVVTSHLGKEKIAYIQYTDMN